MGTRSLVCFKDDDGREIATVYRQFDGYPKGMGADLQRIIGSKRLVNGYSSGDEGNAYNGIGCLAASVICELKKGADGTPDIGSVYVEAPGSRNMGEEYIYTLYADSESPAVIRVHITSTYNGLLYDGPIADVTTFNPTGPVTFGSKVVPGVQSPKVAKHRNRFRNPNTTVGTATDENPSGYKYRSPRTGKWIKYPYNGR